MLKGDLSVPNWLFHFKIHIAEYTPELDKYLVQEEEIYQQIIYPDWENIISKTQDISNLYEKTVYYFGLKEDNKIFRTQKFVYTKSGFLLSNQVFFNSELTKLGSQYVYLQNAIQSLFDLPTPEKQIMPYLLKDPFKIEWSKFCGRTAKAITLEVYEIKSILSFCKLNNEQFFKNFIIKKSDNGFTIIPKTNTTYQITSSDNEARKFIDENCKDRLFVLPYEFLESKDEDGIVKADDLHSLILECVDVNEHKKSLIDIVKHRAKYQFLQKLSEFRFNSEITYTKDDYEYKVLELACNELKESDYQKFKDKVVIETENQDLKLSEIPPFTDKIKIDNYEEISLAKILPDNYENSDYLTCLINQFIGLGLNKERIANLFGISEEPEPSDIFQIFSEQVEILDNAEQLAFAILYNKHIGKIDLKTFKVLAKGGGEYDLTYSFYTKQFNFLVDDASLDDRYKGIKKILGELPFKVTDDNELLEEPYFIADKFICPDLVKENLSEEQKISFVEFLFNQWEKKNKKTVIKDIDWSKIDDVETETILGFNPTISVYPSKYACESEVLPDYLIEWIGDDENKIDFLTGLGVWTENSVIVELRKYLSGEIKDFHNNRLAQEKRFNEDETALFNSLEWLKEKEISLKSEEQFETFKKVVDVINGNRTNKGNLEIKDEFDFDKLKDNAIEWEESYYENWKEDANVSIFLYEGEMPKTVGLDEIDNYVFYCYNQDNYAINENAIYLNSNEDKKKTLQKIASDDKNDFSFGDLWVLFGESSKREQELEREITRLQQQVAKTDNATLGAEFSSDISKNNQKEANREAKEIVKEKLEKEGFEFTKGIGGYSTIDGVFKDDVEFPLVVKSYKYQDEPLKIGTNEWIQLMKPNSMFWVNFGNGKLGCLKLYELLRNQDKLTITFSTENLDVEDRLDKFAELLHYFGNVHFDFNSVMPSNIASNLGDYRFDERKTEEDLSSDDENIL